MSLYKILRAFEPKNLKKKNSLNLGLNLLVYKN